MFEGFDHVLQSHIFGNFAMNLSESPVFREPSGATEAKVAGAGHTAFLAEIEGDYGAEASTVCDSKRGFRTCFLGSISH